MWRYESLSGPTLHRAAEQVGAPPSGLRKPRQPFEEERGGTASESEPSSTTGPTAGSATTSSAVPS